MFQLPRANNQQRWIAPSASKRDILPQDKEQIHNDLVFRRVRGILNKITPEKFEKLINDILNIIGNGSNTIFKGVILLVRTNNSSELVLIQYSFLDL